MRTLWRPLTPWDQKFYTSISRQRADEVVESTLRYTYDERADDRKRAGECRCCFYLQSSRIGGAAMTTWNCGLCGVEAVHASTATPRLCNTCGDKHELCTWCGGDVQMRARRKKPWATPVAPEALRVVDGED